MEKRRFKKHYAVIRNGNYVGETWAVSAKKAISNIWWKQEKLENRYSSAEYSVDDYDAVEL